MDNKPPPLDSWVWTRQHGRSSCWNPARTLSISQTQTCAVDLMIFVQTEVEKKCVIICLQEEKKNVPNIYMYLKTDFFFFVKRFAVFCHLGWYAVCPKVTMHSYVILISRNMQELWPQRINKCWLGWHKLQIIYSYFTNWGTPEVGAQYSEMKSCKKENLWSWHLFIYRLCDQILPRSFCFNERPNGIVHV